MPKTLFAALFSFLLSLPALAFGPQLVRCEVWASYDNELAPHILARATFDPNAPGVTPARALDDIDDGNLVRKSFSSQGDQGIASIYLIYNGPKVEVGFAADASIGFISLEDLKGLSHSLKVDEFQRQAVTYGASCRPE